MKTKIVYVVASSDKDIYMEQAFVSAWSARYYNPGCQIEMVCDQDTIRTLDSGIRAQHKSLFDKIHVREFMPEQGMMERSRWMKTTLREIIEGDFLYLDTDTVVCANLSYVDDFDFDLGMAVDCNSEFKQLLFHDWVVSSMKRIYDMDVSKETLYYNGGVAFVRDCPTTREFFRRWNENWIYSVQKFNIMKDQQPLMKTNIEMGYVLNELSGDLNCIVTASIKYLHTAHVVHFLNNLMGKCEDISPFNKALYIQLKEDGLTEDLKKTILNCKSEFASPSMLISRDGALLWRYYLSTPKFEAIVKSNSYRVLNYVWHLHPKIMSCIESVLGFLLRVLKK